MDSFATVPTTQALWLKVNDLVRYGRINMYTVHAIMPQLIHYIVLQSQCEPNSMGAHLNTNVFLAGICELFGV